MNFSYFASTRWDTIAMNERFDEVTLREFLFLI